MRLHEFGWIVSALLIVGCATPASKQPGLPGTLIRDDEGTLSGVWRGRSGLVVTIDLHINTFAAQKGCTLSGGALVALGNDHFRIDRYDSGYSTDQCGPWRNAAAIAPFDGGSVGLVRAGKTLLATAGNTSVTLVRLEH